MEGLRKLFIQGASQFAKKIPTEIGKKGIEKASEDQAIKDQYSDDFTSARLRKIDEISSESSDMPLVAQNMVRKISSDNLNEQKNRFADSLKRSVRSTNSLSSLSSFSSTKSLDGEMATKPEAQELNQKLKHIHSNPEFGEHVTHSLRGFASANDLSARLKSTSAKPLHPALADLEKRK